MSVDKSAVAYPVGTGAPPASNPYGGNYSYSAQPVTTGTYAAPPAGNTQPSVVVVQNPQYASPPPSDRPLGPPTGHWRDGLCDCFSNLWPSCGCNFIFHGAWLASQSMCVQ